MNEPRIYVDFNELIESNLVLLSKTDVKLDSDGNKISLSEGLLVKIYDDDIDEKNQEDNLVASGKVEINTFGSWTSNCKWNCRIDSDGIRNESELNKEE